MLKEGRKHVLVVIGLMLVILLFSINLIYFGPSITGNLIYSSPADGSTINDTFLRNPLDSNFGTQTYIRVGRVGDFGAEHHGLFLDSNITSIGFENTLISAVLQLYVEASIGAQVNRTIGVYRVTSSWIELEAGWNNRSLVNSWSSAGGDYLEEIVSFNVTNETGYYNISIVLAARNWVNGSFENYGLILIPSEYGTGNYTDFSSSDSVTQAQRPRIFVDYSSNAYPIFNSISTDSNVLNPKNVGEDEIFTVDATDLEGDDMQMFVCSNSTITTSGCAAFTYCNTSLSTTNPMVCNYTVQSSDSRATNFYISVCDIYNCSPANLSTFYMNHDPSVLLIDPNGGETVNQSLGNYDIFFNVSDSDSDLLFANIYYGDLSNLTEEVVVLNLNLSENCIDLDSNTNTTNLCNYSWYSVGIYGTYNLTIIINDSFSLVNDSSDLEFDVRSLIDVTDPVISSPLIDSYVFSGKSTTINATITETNMGSAWIEFNYTSVNVSMTNNTLTNYIGSFEAPAVGTYEYRIHARDRVTNLGSSSWQTFSVTKPVMTVQNEEYPDTSLPFHTIRISAQLNGSDAAKGVYAYLRVPSGFYFLSDYEQNQYLGDFSTDEVKNVTWFLSVPLSEATYILNISYTDLYGNNWNSSDFSITVTSSIGGGYDLSVSGYPEISTNDDYVVRAELSQNSVFVNADFAQVRIYNPVGLSTSLLTMTSVSTGIYNYTYDVGASPTTGIWQTIINITKNGNSYFATHYFKLLSALYDVRNINIVDDSTDDLNISVELENIGTAAADLFLYWNLTRESDGVVLDSGMDTIGVNGGETVVHYVEPTTSYIGQVRITFLGYYEITEKAGAYDVFSTVDGNESSGENETETGGETGGGSSGGGGGGGADTAVEDVVLDEETQKYDFEVISASEINLTQNIAKNVKVIVKNTGEKDLKNIVLSIVDLDSRYFEIGPAVIEKLRDGESFEFIVSFFTTDLEGEDYFYYVVRSDELEKKIPAKIKMLDMKNYFLGEIINLRERIKLLKKILKKEAQLTELKRCEGIVEILIENVDDESYIEAKENLIRADYCLEDLEELSLEDEKKPFAWFTVFAWMFTWLLLIILILVIVAVVYVLYKRSSFLSMLRRNNYNLPGDLDSSGKNKGNERKRGNNKRKQNYFRGDIRFNERISNLKRRLSRNGLEDRDDI